VSGVASDGYDYTVPSDGFSIGDIVRVPLRSDEKIGTIWERSGDIDYPIEKVRAITGATGHSLAPGMLEFLGRVAVYNMIPRGMALKLAVLDDAVKEAPLAVATVSEPAYAAPELGEAQAAAAAVLRERIGAGYSCTLLDGITGSGKTEVYFNAVARALETPAAQVLIMLPEIALTSQFLDKFERRFGAEPVLWHSACTTAQRRKAWRLIESGFARVVVGTRSSLFLPFSNLALIVLDEEHDASYKQEDNAIYHGRDMAVMRAAGAGIPIVLASATPSIETVKNVAVGRYGSVKLGERFGGARLPQISIIDLRLDKPAVGEWMSPPLIARIGAAIEAGQQAMLYINRRGFAPLVMCKGCGHRVTCPNCSVYMTAHGRENPTLKCHYCGHSGALPRACEKCGAEESWLLYGPGIERIEEEIRARFPVARIAVISSDILTSQTRLSEIITSIERRECDIILGTQIIAKGHHFPGVTLVGVIDGDGGFSTPDLRANESAFQLLTQVSGRSGRGEIPGEVVIQTYDPEHPVIRSITAGDRDGFLSGEMKSREAAGMPPFTRLAAVLVQGRDRDALEIYCRELARRAPIGVEGIRCYGPIDAPLQQIKRYYRKRFLLIARSGSRVQDVIRKWLSMLTQPPSVSLKIDIDPHNFM